MWAAEPPTATARDVALACANGLRDEDLRERLRASIHALEANSATYQRMAIDGTLGSLDEDYLVDSSLSADELRWLYDNRLAKNTSPARPLYNALLASAPRGRCVYCFFTDASSLDHFAPKQRFAQLAIEPWNLVPSCHVCNNTWNSKEKSSKTGASMHPYAMPPIGRWLYATVSSEPALAVTFYAQPDHRFPSEIAESIIHNFERLQLGDRLAKHSSVEIAFLQAILRSFAGDLTGAASFVAETAAAEFEAHPNNWRGALFEAASANVALLARFESNPIDAWQ